MKQDWTQKFSQLAKRTSPPEISWLMAQALEVPDMISLAAGFVDQESLPNNDVLEIVNETFNDSKLGKIALQYGTTQGNLDLRRLLVQKLQSESVFHPNAEIDESCMILGSGSQQILYLATEAMVNEGDIVLLEAPTYFVVLGAFNSRGARTIGIDTDEHGMIPDSLHQCLEQLHQSQELHKVKMLYLMSYSTNPQGITITEERRRHIIDLLRSYRERGYPILLLEDAAYRRICFQNDHLLPMKSYDEHNEFVLYTESFSKSLSPGIRLGFGFGPKQIIEKMIDLKGTHDFGSSNLSQHIVQQLVQSGRFDQHTNMLQTLYKNKCDFVLKILKELLPTEAQWIQPSGGFYVWIILPAEIDTGANSPVFEEAIKEKVLYVPGSLCYSRDRPEATQSSCLRLAFGLPDEMLLQLGCERLARALNTVIPVTV